MKGEGEVEGGIRKAEGRMRNAPHLRGGEDVETMGEYLEAIKILWEKAATDEAGKREISQFDQIIDFLVTQEGRLVERFQIETQKG